MSPVLRIVFTILLVVDLSLFGLDDSSVIAIDNPIAQRFELR
jgi:hypothetical protein